MSDLRTLAATEKRLANALETIAELRARVKQLEGERDATKGAIKQTTRYFYNKGMLRVNEVEFLSHYEAVFAAALEEGTG